MNEMDCAPFDIKSTLRYINVTGAPTTQNTQRVFFLLSLSFKTLFTTHLYKVNYHTKTF